MTTPTLYIYWILYILLAIVAQQHLSGVDALAPGFLIALQFGRIRLVIWLFILFVLLQEGTGSLRFGASVLWYGGQVAIYYICSRLFQVDNVIAMLLFAFLFALYGGLLTVFMCLIQDSTVDTQMVIRDGVVQAIVIPVVWLLAAKLRQRTITYASN